MFEKKYKIKFDRKILRREKVNAVIDNLVYTQVGVEMSLLYQIQEKFPFKVVETHLDGVYDNHIIIKCKKKYINPIVFDFMIATQDILTGVSFREWV